MLPSSTTFPVSILLSFPLLILSPFPISPVSFLVSSLVFLPSPVSTSPVSFLVSSPVFLASLVSTSPASVLPSFFSLPSTILLAPFSFLLLPFSLALSSFPSSASSHCFASNLVRHSSPFTRWIICATNNIMMQAAATMTTVSKPSFLLFSLELRGAEYR